MPQNSQVKKERPLSDERYDEKLFKQAYRAALEAKRLAKENGRKKKAIKILSIFLGMLIVTVGVWIYILLQPEHYDRIESVETSQFEQFRSQDYSIESVSADSKLNAGNMEVSAKSALVFDPDNGEILFEKSANEKRAVASLTKLITTLVILDSFDMEEQIQVSNQNIPGDVVRQLNLKDGYMISARDLLEAILVSSYNDAAYIAANAYPYGGYEEFVKAMNRKAQVLGMADTHFSNPAGIDDPENYSTAKDIARAVSAVINRKEVLNTVKKRGAVISWKDENSKINSRTIYTTNSLYDTNVYVQGLKTGITDAAGECFAGYFVYPNGKRVITIVLGSEDRFEDTKIMEKTVRSILLK